MATGLCIATLIWLPMSAAIRSDVEKGSEDFDFYHHEAEWNICKSEAVETAHLHIHASRTMQSGLEH